MRSLLVFLLCGLADIGVASQLEDTNLSVFELLTKYGYQSESHTVETKDGYLLTLHRIPYGAKCKDRGRGPVLLQHGLLSSSADWIIMGPKQGLGYILADHCYDVWLGNSRGNVFSRNHTSLSPRGWRFWDFSWHHMALFDLPAVIDFILEDTGSPDLLYIGHSQGTTQFFIYAATRPEEANKVRAMFALAPVAFLSKTQSLLLKVIAEFQGSIGWVTRMLGMREFMPRSDLITTLGNVCSDSFPAMQLICTNTLFLIMGFDSEQLNTTMLPVIMGHTPAGASTKQVLHYAQGMQKGTFRQYDHGFLWNLYEYGSFAPPDYNLSDIRVPISFHYSANDNFAAVPDVEVLWGMIGGPKIGKFLVPWEKFNHLDHLWAINVKDLLYDPLVGLMSLF